MAYKGILTTTIKDLDFVQTCAACPEQYDVFNGEGKQVGYVRLRWGNLTCEYPDCGGELIYENNVGDGWSGCFEDDSQRSVMLDDIANAILRRMDKAEYRPVKQVRCINDLREDVFGPWYAGYCYEVIHYDTETDEWHINNAYGEAGIVDAEDFDEYFERIDIE